MNNNIGLLLGGIKCDNPNCDWQDNTIEYTEFENWLNKPCPKCGNNVLTDTDFENSQAVLNAFNLINEITPEQIELIKKGIIPTTGISNLFDGFTDTDNVIATINTHEEISISDIRKSNDIKIAKKKHKSKDKPKPIFVEITLEQRRKLNTLWHIYGNNGEKMNFSQHKFIQWILEQGKYYPEILVGEDAKRMAETVAPKNDFANYELSDECRQKVDEILFPIIRNEINTEI